MYFPEIVAQRAKAISCGATHSAIVIDGSVHFFSNGSMTKLGNDVCSASCGPSGSLACVDNDGIVSRFRGGEGPAMLRPINCSERIAEVSEASAVFGVVVVFRFCHGFLVRKGVFGTLMLVGSNRSVLGEQLFASLKFFTDFSFRCEDKVAVNCHRCMLVARLEPTSWILQQTGPEIDCSQVPSRLVELFLLFVYTDRCVPALGDVANLTNLAEKWGLPSLVKYLQLHSSEKTLLRDQMKKLLESGECSDVSLVVGNVSIPAHRAILAARSQYHRTLLLGGFAEAASSTLVVDTSDLQLSSSGLSSSTDSEQLKCVKLMIEFIYCDHIDFEVWILQFGLLFLTVMIGGRKSCAVCNSFGKSFSTAAVVANVSASGAGKHRSGNNRIRVCLIHSG